MQIVAILHSYFSTYFVVCSKA